MQLYAHANKYKCCYTEHLLFVQKENGTEGETGKEEKKKYERGEALSASPLTDLLNYVTAMSFASFEVSESKLKCVRAF